MAASRAANDDGARRRLRGPAAWGVGLGITVLALNWFLGSSACLETSGCAYAEMREWQGRVFTNDGRPANRSTIRYSFESVRGIVDAVSIRSDQQGRYCFRWPDESASAYVTLGHVGSSADPDTRFARASAQDFRGGPGTASIIVSPDVTMETISALPATKLRRSGTLWQASDAPPKCPLSSVQPPWYRVHDLKENWRYRLLTYLSLGCVAFSLAMLVVPRTRHSHAARVAALLGGIDAAFFILIWAKAI